MTVQYISDLHLEFPINQKYLKSHTLQVTGDILLLGGDIVPFVDLPKVMPFFQELANKYEQVYWIPGNHEYYGFDVENGRIGTFEEKILPNVTLLNNKEVNLAGVRLLLSTLWSHIPVEDSFYVQKGMADFRYILQGGQKITVDQYNEWHEEAMKFLRAATVAQSTVPTIVLTHHVPTYDHYPKEFKNSPISSGFATELYDLIEISAVDYWIFGHHHRNAPMFPIGKTQLLTNQLGYVWMKEHKRVATNSQIILPNQSC